MCVCVGVCVCVCARARAVHWCSGLDAIIVLPNSGVFICYIIENLNVLVIYIYIYRDR